MDGKNTRVLSFLQAQCARREYCRDDVFKKAVTKLEGDRDAAAEIVDELVKDSFVDDLRYATAFAREKSSLNGWGPVKIRFALAAKNIGSSIISEALGEIDGKEAEEKLEKMLSAKWKTLEGDPQARLKLIKFALSRGYDYDAVKGPVARISDGQV